MMRPMWFGRLLMLVCVLLATAACHNPTSPSAGNRLVSATVTPPNGVLTGPDEGIGFSVQVQCGGDYVAGLTLAREDGRMEYWGVFLSCPAKVSEYHQGGSDLSAAVWQFGQGGHRVSLEMVVATDEQNARAGNILFRSEAFATWEIP